MEEEKLIKKIKLYINSYIDFPLVEYQVTFGNPVDMALDAYIQTTDIECYTSIPVDDYTEFNKNISKSILKNINIIGNIKLNKYPDYLINEKNNYKKENKELIKYF